jgi:hypothetical protein
VGVVEDLCVPTSRFNAQWYLSFLENVLQQLLEDVPQRMGNNLWHKHDRTPARNESAAPQAELMFRAITWRPRFYHLTISVI